MLVTYQESVPPALLPLIKERVGLVEHLFPNWCQQLMVSYSSENEENYVLSCKSEYAYRFVQLTVYDLFFYDEDWQNSLVHEVMHAICAPYSTQAWQLIDLLDISPQIRQYIEQHLRSAEEAMAQDMSAFAAKLCCTNLTKTQ